jgi:heme exporter protein CcmD
MTEFFHMGGYGGYIWPAYAAAFVGLTGLTIYIVRRNTRVREGLKRVELRLDEQRRPENRSEA